VVFDLDDTLYKEVDYVKSAYRYIAGMICRRGEWPDEVYGCLLDSYFKGLNALDEVNRVFGFDVGKEEFLGWYRSHNPSLALPADTLVTLEKLKGCGVRMGLMTDGRSVTQRNKIKAMGLSAYIPDRYTVISEEFGSEKPSEANYRYFMDLCGDESGFVYVGDNPQKDFITANGLGWQTVGLRDNGCNIHRQQFIDEVHEPQLWIERLSQIVEIVKTGMH